MLDSIFKQCKGELINGYAKKRHPFRYFTLATISDGQPRQRTVVLRRIIDDFTLLIYTDKRSQKVHDIRLNNLVSTLFYHPKKLTQIKLDCEAQIINDPVVLDYYWKTISETSKKDYITSLAPGTSIGNSEHVDYLSEGHNFCAIMLNAYSLEYLQIRRQNHLRINFSKTNTGWQGQFLVP